MFSISCVHVYTIFPVYQVEKMELQKMMTAKLICMAFLRKFSSCLYNSPYFFGSAPITRQSTEVTWCQYHRYLTEAKSVRNSNLHVTVDQHRYFSFTPRLTVNQDISNILINPLFDSVPLQNKHIKFGSETLTDFKDELTTNKEMVMTKDDWTNLREACLEDNRALSKSFDMIVMQLMYGSRQLSLAIEFMEWVEIERKPHFSVQAVFLALCGVYGGKEHQHRVFRAYDNIIEQTKLFDALTCKYLIKGFSCTDQWKKSIEFLEMSRITQSPSESYYNPICFAALKEGDAELADKLLVEMGENYLVPSEEVLLQYILQCQHSQNGVSITKFLYYLRKFFWFPSKPVAESLEKYFLMSKHGNWCTNWATVSKSGDCDCCGARLERATVKDSEFQDLAQNFSDNVLYGKNIYFKSSPEEILRFKEFVKCNGPFDVVLDALNIVHKNSRKPQLKNLNAVVGFFSRHKKVLVIGRVHMLKWNRKCLEDINSKAKTFYLENVSEDDPFMLYAALLSGRNARFVSRDEMRDHKFLLDRNLQETFQKWQRSHQIRINRISPNGYVDLLMPCLYDTAAQQNRYGSWHIPYLAEDISEEPKTASFEHPKTYLCVQMMGVGKQKEDHFKNSKKDFEKN
ncbi:hypothetical protein ScPMuIL_013987 [Solemya velum]